MEKRKLYYEVITYRKEKNRLENIKSHFEHLIKNNLGLPKNIVAEYNRLSKKCAKMESAKQDIIRKLADRINNYKNG